MQKGSAKQFGQTCACSGVGVGGVEKSYLAPQRVPFRRASLINTAHIRSTAAAAAAVTGVRCKTFVAAAAVEARRVNKCYTIPGECMPKYLKIYTYSTRRI